MVSRADRTIRPITSQCNCPVRRISYEYDMECILSEKGTNFILKCLRNDDFTVDIMLNYPLKQELVSYFRTEFLWLPFLSTRSHYTPVRKADVLLSDILLGCKYQLQWSRHLSAFRVTSWGTGAPAGLALEHLVSNRGLWNLSSGFHLAIWVEAAMRFLLCANNSGAKKIFSKTLLWMLINKNILEWESWKKRQV